METASTGEWRDLLPDADLGVTPKAMMADGRALVVWRTASGRVCVLDDDCPHQGTELSGGSVDGETLRCPKHGWAVGTDGWCDQAAASTPSHRVQVRDGMITVRLRQARPR